MKRFTRFANFFAFFLFILSNINVADANPLVAIELSLTEVNVGEEFMVNIIITDEDIVNMAGWNGSVLFDPAILSLQDAMVGDFIVPDTDFSYNEPTPGIVNMIEFGFSQSGVSGQGIIAFVNFIALKPGNTFIEVSNFAFTDPDAKEILVDIGDNVAVTVVTEEAMPGDLDGDGDVDRDDLNIILAARNTPADGADDPRDLDNDGMITALDARKLVLLCTRPRCACEEPPG